MKLSAFAMLVTLALSACASRPYYCEYKVYPPEADYLEEGWKHAARVCETRIERDLFTYQRGVLLAVLIEDAAHKVIAEREIFFVDVDRVDFESHWLDEKTLSVRVIEDMEEPGDEKLGATLADLIVTLPIR